MNLAIDTAVAAPPDRVWAVLVDIDRAAETIRGIESVEVLERPSEGLVGLTWRETRVMFGKPATETMWITAAEDGRWYETRAESHGAVYISRMSVAPEGDGSRLGMSFRAEPQSLGAKVMAKLTGWLAVGAMRKMVAADLADIKAKTEVAAA